MQNYLLENGQKILIYIFFDEMYVLTFNFQKYY